MAKKKPFVMNPKTGFDDLKPWEQDHIERFLRVWATQTQEPKAKWAMVAKHPKTIRWLRGLRPADSRHRAFAEGGRVLTPDQRVKIGLQREAGPRYAPRRTEEEEIAAEGRRGKRYSERDALRRIERGARDAKDEAARDERWRERDAARALEKRARELAAEADREKRWAERDARAWAVRRAREIEAEVAREKRWRARDERASLHKVGLEIERETLRRGRWEAYEATRYGTASEKGALARLKASGYAVPVAVRIFDEGRWEAMERLDRGCTAKVLENWVRFETPRWAARLVRGKKPWEVTRADVAASRLSQEQLNRVAAANASIHRRLEGIGVKTQRPMPVGVMLRSIGQLGRRVPKGQGFWLTIPGPLPLRVPVPAVRTWAKPRGGVLPQRLERERGRPWEPLRERQRRIAEARLKPAEAVFAGKSPAAKEPGKVPVAKAVVRAMPELIGTAIQTGAIPARSGLAEVYGAYALSQMAKGALLRAGLAGAVAGPLGIAIGLASLFTGWRRSRRARREYRAKRERLRAAAAARVLRAQVGYVPRRVGVRYEPRRRRGYARPFAALYGSRLGLARGTRTPPARI